MKEELENAVNELQLTYVAEFVPTKQPVDKVKDPQLHWSITLQRGQRKMTVPYHEGCGHVVGYQQFHKTPYDKRRHDEMVREVCETGIAYKNVQEFLSGRIFKRKTKQPVPKLLDVLYCLVQDASVLDSGGFEEWASDYGYDTDSRAAEKTYRQCVDQSLQLRNLLDNDNLEQLRKLYQDY